ncbi:MAG TPA: glycosyltransferase family 2 protein [Chloroflexota bacterium]|nr:glycosyltransferase family 2 protein [Chloroflexota bacterium]
MTTVIGAQRLTQSVQVDSSTTRVPFVSVLVLNWNGKRILPACLNALNRTEYPAGRWEAVLVDNASSDGSLEAAAQAHPWLRIHRNEGNWGFARGYNRSMSDASGPYVVLLNSDTRVRPGWLKALVAAAESDPRVGAATAKLIFPESSPHAGCIQNAGGIVLANGSGRDRGTVFQEGSWVQERDNGQYDRPEEVFFFCGAAALLRKDALQDVGLFDERYFMYYEDMDLSWRLRLRGWKVLFVPDAVVEHEHAASSQEWSPLFIYNVDRNRPLMLLKLAPLPLALREIARYSAEFALNCVRVLWWAISRRQRGPHAARTKMQARVILSWIRDLPSVLTDRWRIQQRRLVPEKAISRWMVQG